MWPKPCAAHTGTSRGKVHVVVGIGAAAEWLTDYRALRARWACAGISTRWILVASRLELSAAWWTLIAAW